jgi:hypothetical protein
LPRFHDVDGHTWAISAQTSTRDADVELGAAHPGRLDDAKKARQVQVAFGLVRQAAQALAVGGAFIELGQQSPVRAGPFRRG